MAYAEHEPFGYPMENYRMGVMTAEIINAIHRTIPIPKGKPRPRTRKPEDFYPAQKKGANTNLTAEQREYLEQQKHGRQRKRRNSNG